MKTEKIHEGVGKVIQSLDKTDLRIDEKMAVCRAAGDFYNQILSAESLIVVMQKAMMNMEGK
jgi:hypothetical protein